VRRAAALACALLGTLAALALTGCETTAEKSAKLERVAKRQAQSRVRVQQALTVTRPSSKVAVTSTAVLHSSEGTAAVVTLHNLSATSLRALPIQITVKDAAGASLYTNAIPGLATSLASVALVPAHATTTWIDDQVQASGAPSGVVAKVGEGQQVTGAIPQIAVEGAHLSEGGVEGTVVNRSRVAQRELVLDVLVRRGGAIVAAGRAVVSQAEPNGSTRFQAFLIGSPRGGRLEVSALASTVG
jgi:hypothetical protein